jgi:flagellar biosynthetic protein FliS
MQMNFTNMSYRQAALHGATGFGLLIAMYDTVIANLRRAAEAQRNRDIQLRCNEVNHALLVLGFLESWIDSDSQGDLAQQLLNLYRGLRCSLITAQAKHSAELLEQYVPELLNLRMIWQQLELNDPGAHDGCGGPVAPITRNYSSDATPLSISA